MPISKDRVIQAVGALGLLGLGSVVALVVLAGVGSHLSSGAMVVAIAAVLLLGGTALGFVGVVLMSLQQLTRQGRALPALIGTRDAQTRQAIAEVGAKGEQIEKTLGTVRKTLRQFSRPGPQSPLSTTAFAVEFDKRMLELVEALRQVGAESSAAANESARAIARSEETVRRSIENTYGQIEGLFAVYTSLGSDGPLPAFRGWAVSPDLAAHLMRVLYERRPALVVETGSGLSTLLMGLALRRLGEGRVVALEHDGAYAAATAALLQQFGVAACAEVVHAPLADHDIEGAIWLWYDLAGVKLDRPIDVLVVDGPPQGTGPQARYPALPLLARHLAPGAIVILDDVLRPDESEALDHWTSRFPDFTLELLDHEKGTAQLRRSGSRYIVHESAGGP